MTREQKIHWLENAAFEKGGTYKLSKSMPVAYGNIKYDTTSSIIFYAGEPLMISLDLANKQIPIEDVTDDSIAVLFKEVCLRK